MKDTDISATDCAVGHSVGHAAGHLALSRDEVTSLIRLLESPQSHVSEEINVVPLIDVLLVLLVALLVALPVLTQQMAISVPQTATVAASHVKQSPLHVLIDGSGIIRWPDGKDFSNPNRPLIVQADASVAYDVVAKVLADASTAGMRSIELMTRR